MSDNFKAVENIMYFASSRDDAKEKILNLKDVKKPSTRQGVKVNIYKYIEQKDDEYFDKIEKHFIKKAKTNNKELYAGEPELVTDIIEEGKKANDLIEQTKQYQNELNGLQEEINKLKQDEANLKEKIDGETDMKKREDLKKNIEEVIEKRRATEESAQIFLNEIIKAPRQMQNIDPSKVSEIEKIINNMPDFEEEEEKPPVTTTESPTMSPDEMEEERKKEEERKDEEERKEEERKEEERKADEEEKERARVRRELGEREARRREEPQVTPSKGKDGPEMKITRSKADTVPDDIQPLPMERISTRNKSLAQLLDDLKFFFAQYPDTLRRDKEKYQKLDKMSMPLVERFHKMIVGKLYDPKKSRERVGIILDAREYIAQQVNEILARRATEGLRPEEIVSITQPEKKSDAQDYGNYEVKEGREGGVQFLRREPLYRLMPEINDKNVYPIEAKEKKGRLRVGPPQTRYNSMVQNAKIEFKQNPFTKKENVTRLRF